MIAKLGMDAHWRGAIVVAKALRDAGMEVVYVGHVTPEELAAVVAQEDPVLVGISALSGNHLAEGPHVVRALRDSGASDVLLVIGGAIPEAHETTLVDEGFDAVFPTGTGLSELLQKIAALVVQHHAPARDADTQPVTPEAPSSSVTRECPGARRRR